MLSYLSSWATTLSLIFGGCCANALTLEQITLAYPHFGSLITFLQFLLIALHGLPSHVAWTRYGPRLKPRRIPLLPYLAQVFLFYLISTLNNEAFAYRIPMAVHIIFRSGGLVVSMIFGWLISKKMYNITQVLSVVLVTIGVGLTTLSASQPSKSKEAASSDLTTYLKGIGILSSALVLSGFLGLVQEWTYKTYGKPSSSTAVKDKPTWRESMFYLHVVGLPLFLAQRTTIKEQIAMINHASPRAETTIPLRGLPVSLASSFFPSLKGSTPPIPPPFRLPSLDFLIPPSFRNNDFAYFDVQHDEASSAAETARELVSFKLSLPKLYLPLFLNTLTQLFCVAGVHRLTTRVSNLTVTLILVVRKAVSLVISLKGRVLAERATQYLGVQALLDESKLGAWVWNSAGALLKVALGVDEEAARKRTPPKVDEGMMWTGAGLVLLGTLGYTLGTGFAVRSRDKSKKE